MQPVLTSRGEKSASAYQAEDRRLGCPRLNQFKASTEPLAGLDQQWFDGQLRVLQNRPKGFLSTDQFQ